MFDGVASNLTDGQKPIAATHECEVNPCRQPHPLVLADRPVQELTLVPNSMFATRATQLRAFHATETPELPREEIARLGRGIAIVTATTDNARTFLERFLRTLASVNQLQQDG
jgi:hypothetical protein